MLLRPVCLLDVLHGLVEELPELFERGGRVAAGVGSVVVPGCHQMGVGVLLELAWSVEVVEEADGALPALLDPGDHAGERVLALVEKAVGGVLDTLDRAVGSGDDHVEFARVRPGVDGSGDLVEVAADVAEVSAGGEELGYDLAFAGDGARGPLEVAGCGEGSTGEEACEGEASGLGAGGNECEFVVAEAGVADMRALAALVLAATGTRRLVSVL
ncbi:hypothetical protein SMALB_3543 [Streptomyces malaysiensis]|uniref:Uncharacterized protein n=1 Tax=Streptomyces malaysiensis TaxID=92644 RepID=A0A7X6AXQ5_STRMQ|nr:hypothetical protein [Streptomyces malaysiensis]